MTEAVLKGAGYVLVHTPGMVINNGSTQTTERAVNPGSEYLQKIPEHLRTYEQALAYAPHQVFIGNLEPEALKEIPFPWYAQESPIQARAGRFGEIMPEDEFIGLMQAVDTFDLVRLADGFAESVRLKMAAHPLLSPLVEKIKPGVPMTDIDKLITDAHAEALTVDGKNVGCVRRAHDLDPNLNAHVMLENLASKASATLALKHMADKNKVDMRDIEYVIECSEEACGDMNQRGGGNFAKSVAEAAGAINATGCDTRGFCAAPVHALIEAASLVKAGTFKQVAVVAGGATAKLGMNGKDHVKKGLPILEDVLGGFAVLVGEDDGINPVIRTNCVGRHTVGAGSAPQAVITSLVAAPLTAAGLRITDVDKFAAEMQNPDITKPAGAGDVPEANYKMIAALSVMRKEIERADIPRFIEKHGMPGYAPTQGHIPSGAPFLGYAREGLTTGTLNKVMIVGKGSLFLGRMTNLFDGISVLLERNTGKQTDHIADEPISRKRIRVGLTINGSEHGEAALIAGARLAVTQNDDLEAVLIGALPPGHQADHRESRITYVQTQEKDAHRVMEEWLDSGKIDACVTMHYSFPIGVSTVGRAVTPGLGREMFIATTTGASAAGRTDAMVKNAVYGIAAAKALGIAAPTVGILNVDGAVKTEATLRKLRDNGYDLHFSESVREDGGVLMRGNDLLRGEADVMVTDTLTGNIVMKMLSSFTTGGVYESSGSGYGPGLGENYDRLVLILSRASGTPVAANAMLYAAKLVKGQVLKRLKDELTAARRAGLDDFEKPIDETTADEQPPMPEKEVVTEEIAGIDIMRLDEAVRALWRAGIYAESGMGCTGPVVMVNPAQIARAREAVACFRER